MRRLIVLFLLFSVSLLSYSQITIPTYDDLNLRVLSDEQVLFSKGMLLSGDSQFVWDYLNQRLGVKTSTPAYTLDVNGDARFVSTLNIDESQRFTPISTPSTPPFNYIKVYNKTGIGLVMLDDTGMEFVIGGTAGTITSITAGDGMDFTTITLTGAIDMGTPSSVTATSTNLASGITHTHVFVPAGPDKSVQFNDGGVMGYSSGLNYDKTLGRLTSPVIYATDTLVIPQLSRLTNFTPTGTPIGSNGWLYAENDSLKFKNDLGTIIVLGEGGAGTPGGSDREMQYRNGANFGGAAGSTWDGTYLAFDPAKGVAYYSSDPTIAMKQYASAISGFIEMTTLIPFIVLEVADSVAYFSKASSRFYNGGNRAFETVTGGINAESVIQLGGVSINTTGTLSLVVYDADLAAFIGQANIVTVGTVTTGTWEADVIDHERGGLEIDASAFNGLIKISGGNTTVITDNSTNWTTAYNDKINSGAFNTGTGDLTLTQQDAGTVVTNLDGRYLTSILENNVYFESYDYVGNTVGMFKVSQDNYLVKGVSELLESQHSEFDPGWIIRNLPLRLAAFGDSTGIKWRVGNSEVFRMFGLADGAGGLSDKFLQVLGKMLLANGTYFDDFDTNVALGISNTTVASQLAIKTYVDAQIIASGGGTVVSVALTTPTGLSVSGSPITTTGTFVVTFTAGYSIPLDSKQTNWDAAFAGLHNAVTIGTANGLSLSTQQISMGLSGVASTGSLNSTDWNTFNDLDILNDATFDEDITVTNDVSFTVASKYMLKYIVIENTHISNDATLDLGTTAGNNDVFTEQIFEASEITVIEIEKVFSLVALSTLYLNDDQAGSSWNGTTCNIYYKFEEIVQ